jgi:ActR/RegA family two-component response regulator
MDQEGTNCAPASAGNLQRFEPHHRILIAEDEALVAITLADALDQHGAKAVHLVATAKDGLSLLEAHAEWSAAVLDMKLADGPADPLIEALRARGVPLVITTGYAGAAVDDAKIFTKPYDTEALVKTLLFLCR